MTWRQMIQAAIRAYVLNALTAGVVQDIATNGLTPADELVVEAYLDQTAP